jgi:hypothetical protein
MSLLAIFGGRTENDLEIFNTTGKHDRHAPARFMYCTVVVPYILTRYTYRGVGTDRARASGKNFSLLYSIYIPSQTRNSLRRLSSSLSMAAKATKPIAKWWYSRSPSAKTLKNASRWHYRQHHQAQEVDESALRKWSNSETWYYYSRVDCMWTCVSWTTMTAELQPKVCSLLMIDWMLIFSL